MTVTVEDQRTDSYWRVWRYRHYGLSLLDIIILPPSQSNTDLHAVAYTIRASLPHLTPLPLVKFLVKPKTVCRELLYRLQSLVKPDPRCTEVTRGWYQL